MRTPETDDGGSEEAATLADGFGTVADDSGGGASGGAEAVSDTDFGEGAADGASALQEVEASQPVDSGETQVFLDPSDSYTDTDLDLTGDGIVDAADFHEAVTGFFDFTTDDDGTHGAGDHADADADADSAAHDAPEGDGLFGLFDT